jgi:predicted TPR repeat methyltransferase
MKRLNGKGVFAFSLERGDHHPFKLTDSGRYSHHPDYIRELCNKRDFSIAHLEEEYLRMEYGSEVTGLFVVLQNCV